MATILATQALAKRFGGVVATDDVTLDIMSGELRCIIGPNGAGKSTLFALLCGIHRPDSGHVMLKGQDVTGLPAFRRVRLGLGLTFQTNRAYHHLSVRQNLEIPIPPAEDDRSEGAQARYAYALETFGLDQRLLKIRRKQLTVRQFKPGSEYWFKPITVVNVLVAPLVIVLAGLAYYLLRRA